MQWSEVTKAPSAKMLRQFAALSLVIFGGLAMWRAANGQLDNRTYALAMAAGGIGLVGLAWPTAVRPVYTIWMVVAFPIGWTISKVVLGIMFYGMFSSIGLVFRLIGRDALRIRRVDRESYWMEKPGTRAGREYLRQF